MPTRLSFQEFFMNEHLRTTLRQLRLSGLASSLEVRLHEAQANGLSHLDFLELILQDEVAVRAHARSSAALSSPAFAT